MLFSGCCRGLAVAAILASAQGCAPDRPDRGSAWGVEPETRCAGAVVATLQRWGASTDRIDAAPPRGASTSTRHPTDRLGRWVVLSHTGGNAVVVTRVGPDGAIRRSFDARCRARDRSRPSGLAPFLAGTGPPPFDDAALARMLERTDGWLLYMWSPHMPLSVDGWREAEAAAAGLGLSARPVLIGEGDASFAASEARRVGMPPEGLQPVASVELVMRDAQVHAPSILVFSGGRVSPVLPGYRNTEGYRAFLEAFLAGSGR